MDKNPPYSRINTVTNLQCILRCSYIFGKDGTKNNKKKYVNTVPLNESLIKRARLRKILNAC